MKKISTQIYYLHIPENWDTESSEDGASSSFFDPNGVGAITISSYSLEKSPLDPVKLLEGFVKGKAEIKIRENSVGLNIAESEYEEQNNGNPVLTYAVAICDRNQLLLVSYNCNKNNFSKEELKTAKEVIETVGFNPNNSD